MVPYGQAAHSPDHARHVTFRSQRIQETYGQTHSDGLETGENEETYGQNHSRGTLRVGFALRRPARANKFGLLSKSAILSTSHTFIFTS